MQLAHNGDARTVAGNPDQAVGRWFIDERYRRTEEFIAGTAS